VNKNQSFIFILIFLFLAATNTQAQGYEKLEKTCNDSIRCRFEISIPDNSYKALRSSRGRKLSISKVQLIFNDDDIPVKSIKIRGKTSLYYPKKSFTLKLKDHLTIKTSDGSMSLKDYYLLSLSMDKNYVLNYTAYSLLKSLEIFDLGFNYCEVLINNETQGIYLIIERPEDYAFKTAKSPVLIRRGFNHEIDKIELNDKEYSGKSNYFRKKFNHVYSLCNRYSGKELYDSLNCYIDLSQYMRWLGFNYLVRNGDYTDELFLYYDSATEKFKIIPWDYDDLFAASPHEGKEARRTVQGGQFIFSSEDRLDKTIISDRYLYSRYLEELANLAEELNDEILFDIFQKTYCAVYPYYLDNDIIDVTQYDKYGRTNIDELYLNMESKFVTVRSLRNLVKQQKINSN